MKSIITFFLLVTFQLSFLTSMYAQSIHYRKLGLMKSNGSTTTYIYLGASTNQVSNALGQPTRTDSYHAQLQDKTATNWHYNNCTLTFIDNQLIRYDLNDATLAVGENFSTLFKVGSRVGQRQIRVPGPTKDAPWEVGYEDYFYGYELTVESGRTRNKQYAMISGSGLRDDNGTFEGYFETLFNSSKIITNIHVTAD